MIFQRSTATKIRDEGDAARDAKDWALAASRYREYLGLSRRDFAIWVQLGHALKEGGELVNALIAYSEAMKLRPGDDDLLLNLGHLQKRFGNLEGAQDCYKRSAALGNPFATQELAASAFVNARQLSMASWQSDEAWPPPALDDYWLPSALREYVTETHSEGVMGLYWYLCSVMNRFQSSPDSFPGSEVCTTIVNRLRELSNVLMTDDGFVPDATVVIPVYNNILDTLICLITVFEARGARKFDIIVTDDCSTDATSALLREIGGVVKYIRQPSNLGFLRNCNFAAQRASGRYIVFLNNDTLVLPGWLDQLIEPFVSDENIGLTGSKLLNWDGTLQEAGGIFWRDGSAWNFGRGQNAASAEYNYVKDVDYCSGASIAVPANVWMGLEGFDPEFAPAYCEDSDLAFRIREQGLRTVYVPTSAVIHHEGRSHGRDLGSGVKAYQVANQQKLYERWLNVLEREHFPNGQNVLRARDRSRGNRHVLFIDHYVPQWDKDAGSRTIFQYIKLYLEIGCKVTLWPDNLYYDKMYVNILQGLGVEVIFGAKYVDKFPEFWNDRRDLYDAVFLSRPHVAVKYIPVVNTSVGCRILYYGHDLHFKRMEEEASLHGRGDLVAIEDMKDLELSVCDRCDVIFYPAQAEVDIVSGHLNGRQRVLTNPVFVYEDRELEYAARRIADISNQSLSTLLFVGGFNHTPNVEGISWFVREVLPRVRQGAPDVKLLIAGSNPPREVIALADPHVEVLGFVTDERLEALYSAVSVAVAPLRFGAGVKGKVIEAMAKGVPLATTSTGAQGIADPERLLFLGDTPERLAAAVLQAMANREEAQLRASAALAFIAEHYSARTLKRIFEDISFDPENSPTTLLGRRTR